MRIVLLALLGVSLVVVAALTAIVLGRRRWVASRPRAFKGAIRVSVGDVDGLGPEWRKGYGLWIRDILVWWRGPFLLRSVVVLADSAVARIAEPGEVQRLGEAPLIAEVAAGGASVFVAAEAKDHAPALGPFAGPRRTAAADAGRKGSQPG